MRECMAPRAQPESVHRVPWDEAARMRHRPWDHESQRGDSVDHSQ